MVGIARLIHPKLLAASLVLLVAGTLRARYEVAEAEYVAAHRVPVLVVDGRKHTKHKEPPHYF